LRHQASPELQRVSQWSAAARTETYEAEIEAAPAPVEAPVEIAAEPRRQGKHRSGDLRHADDGAECRTAGGSGSDDERRLHKRRSRFARLLVSEIKLITSRKSLTGVPMAIYQRLREYIDRSREMYERRVNRKCRNDTTISNE